MCLPVVGASLAVALLRTGGYSRPSPSTKDVPRASPHVLLRGRDDHVPDLWVRARPRSCRYHCQWLVPDVPFATGLAPTDSGGPLLAQSMLRDERAVLLDTETTGLSERDVVIELALLSVA